jgi:glycosyltransferase involved in cell wall biosynthesis
MKIVHVVDSMDVGGAEILVSQMCRLQREEGHDPCVYTVSTLGDLGIQMRTEGFLVEPLGRLNLPGSFSTFFRIFRKLRPDVVHLHNPTPTIFAAPAARMAGVPSIVSTRHSLVAAPRKLSVEIKYGVAGIFCDWIVGICDATTNNLKVAHRLLARKVVRVYNGALPLAPVSIEQWPPKNGFTMLFVGRIVPVKNHALMLNAFRIALDSMPTLRLWLVGDGGDRTKMEALAAELGIADRLTFWGQQLDVAPFFSAADTFVMSSTSEGLPMSLLQAFSLGLPAIVTDVGGMGEVVRLAKAGATAPLGDPAKMAEAMLRLAGNDLERAQLSTNAKAAFHTSFGLQTMVDAYADLYRNTPRARRRKHA